MNRADLYRSMNNIDDDILERSETNKKKRPSTWMKFVAMAACVCLLVTGATNIFKKEIEYIPHDDSMVSVALDTFSAICEWSDTIVKAKYIRRESFNAYIDIFVFKVKEDYIGNVDEKYIHIYWDKESSFIHGKNYYLFLTSNHSLLFPHVHYVPTSSGFLVGEVGKGDSRQYTFYNNFSLGLDKVEDISQYIKTEIIAKGAYKKTEEKSESLDDAIMNAEAIYIIKIESVEESNRFVSNGKYTVTETLRERYPVSKPRELPSVLVPSDTKKGDQFILLLKYNEDYQSYEVDYSSMHYLYSNRSKEARYIKKSLEK